jgi:hypothetical protein
VKVRVVDPIGEAFPQATVRISRAADAEVASSGMSDSQGEFSGRIAPGVYSVLVAAAPFRSFQKQLTCKKSGVVSVAAPLQMMLMGEVVEIKQRPFLGRLASLFRRH